MVSQREEEAVSLGQSQDRPVTVGQSDNYIARVCARVSVSTSGLLHYPIEAYAWIGFHKAGSKAVLSWLRRAAKQSNDVTRMKPGPSEHCDGCFHPSVLPRGSTVTRTAGEF